jgi:hypothetical protein
MTGIELIVEALAAGVGAGAGELAKGGVVAAHTALRDLLRRRFAGRPEAACALEADETDPGAWETRIGADISDSGADRDDDVLAAAIHLLRLVDPDGVRTGKYSVDAREARGVQVGDHNVQTNTFS